MIPGIPRKLLEILSELGLLRARIEQLLDAMTQQDQVFYFPAERREI